jgi:hypothetical protein
MTKNKKVDSRIKGTVETLDKQRLPSAENKAGTT